MALILIALSFLFFLGHGLNWFFVKTKIPDLLLLVILGFLAGPVLGLVSAEDFGKVGQVVSTIALIVILYEGGLHLSAKSLLQSSLPALGISLVGFCLIVGATCVLGLAFSLPASSALLLALGVGSTSSAIVIPIVKQLSISEKMKTVLSLESAFTDVMAIVLFLALIDQLTGPQAQGGALLVGLGSKPFISIVFGAFAGLLWAYLKQSFPDLLRMAFAGEAWALLSYGLIETSSMNGALGVLALGFTLANLNLLPGFLKNKVSAAPVSFSELSLLSEVSFLLRTFFFIYLGLLIKLSEPTPVLVAFIITLFILITRWVSVQFLFRPKTHSRLDAMVAVSMGPRGLACAVLATIPLQKGLAGGAFIQDVVFALVPITILVTAIFVNICEKGSADFGSTLFKRYPAKAPTDLEAQS